MLTAKKGEGGIVIAGELLPAWNWRGLHPSPSESAWPMKACLPALRCGIEACRRFPWRCSESLWGEVPLIRFWRLVSFDVVFTKFADESGLASKSVNTGHCPVPASKSEKVG